MLESFEKQFIKGKLPHCLHCWHKEKRIIHTVICFNDDYFFQGVKNNLYKFVDKELYCNETGEHLFVEDFGSRMVFNPQTKEFEDLYLNFEGKNVHFRNNNYDINICTKGYQEYLKVDYEDRNAWLFFDLKSYIQDKYSEEVKLCSDYDDRVDLVINGKKVKIKTISNIDNCSVETRWDNPDCNGHIVGFDEAQTFYSFINELNEELKTIKFGTKYSDLYDSIVAGAISKEDFLKEIL